MIEQKVEETRKLQIETENHISFCAIEIAEKMSDTEITEFANESGSRIMKSAAFRAVNGTHNRTGAKLTDREIASDKAETIRNISSRIQNVIAGRI